jgi:hypothetical protein
MRQELANKEEQYEGFIRRCEIERDRLRADGGRQGRVAPEELESERVREVASRIANALSVEGASTNADLVSLLIAIESAIEKAGAGLPKRPRAPDEAQPEKRAQAQDGAQPVANTALRSAAPVPPDTAGSTTELLDGLMARVPCSALSQVSAPGATLLKGVIGSDDALRRLKAEVDRLGLGDKVRLDVAALSDNACLEPVGGDWSIARNTDAKGAEYDVVLTQAARNLLPYLPNGEAGCEASLAQLRGASEIVAAAGLGGGSTVDIWVNANDRIAFCRATSLDASAVSIRGSFSGGKTGVLVVSRRASDPTGKAR